MRSNRFWMHCARHAYEHGRNDVPGHLLQNCRSTALLVSPPDNDIHNATGPDRLRLKKNDGLANGDRMTDSEFRTVAPPPERSTYGMRQSVQLFASGEGIDQQNFTFVSPSFSPPPFGSGDRLHKIIFCSENDTQWSRESVSSKRSSVY